MIRIVLIIIFQLYILNFSNAQDYSCKIIVAKSKLFKNKKFIFNEGMYTSMKFKNDSIYIIPEIFLIKKDSIHINKRVYFSDDDIKWKLCKYPISSIEWINWDGIPRKKVRRFFFDFTVENSNIEEYCNRKYSLN